VPNSKSKTLRFSLLSVSTFFLLILGYALLPGSAFADEVHDTAYSSGTISGVISLSSTSATRVDPVLIGLSTGSLAGRFVAELFNRDLNLDMFCDFDSRVSTSGRPIEGRASWTLPISGRVQIFCISSAAAHAGCNITQLK